MLRKEEVESREGLRSDQQACWLSLSEGSPTPNPPFPAFKNFSRFLLHLCTRAGEQQGFLSVSGQYTPSVHALSAPLSVPLQQIPLSAHRGSGASYPLPGNMGLQATKRWALRTSVRLGGPLELRGSWGLCALPVPVCTSAPGHFSPSPTRLSSSARLFLFPAPPPHFKP